MQKIQILLNEIETKGFAVVNPRGRSMEGRIKSGETVVLIKQDKYSVNDAVLAKVNGKYYIHLISKIGDKGYLIKNNKGFENGWTRNVIAKAFISA